jgi:hypothetical protein
MEARRLGPGAGSWGSKEGFCVIYKIGAPSEGSLDTSCVPSPHHPDN